MTVRLSHVKMVACVLMAPTSSPASVTMALRGVCVKLTSMLALEILARMEDSAETNWQASLVTAFQDSPGYRVKIRSISA